MQDSDCSAGQTCACRGTVYNKFVNTCVPSNCRVDADCGAGNYCSATVPAQTFCADVGGYYCHTPNDLCLDNSDCADAEADAGAGPAQAYCAYSTTNQRWQCQLTAGCQ
ncbi:MAG TPA: hypothetical protein VF331_05730 [Polyangiales bacterium]